MTHVITQSCCSDAACIPVCPVNCIHPTPDEPDFGTAEMLYIDPDSCIDCGACVEVCPVNAIAYEDDLSDDMRAFTVANSRYFAEPSHQGYPTTPAIPVRSSLKLSESGVLRVAIVGSGPAACYAAEELLRRKDVKAEVSMFERLPTPWGLVRFGVAPDHTDTKSVANAFSRTASRSGMSLYLNVEVGRHLTHEELMTHHHAVIYAVGASSDRRLGIPGEGLPGSHAATEFVGWYNGHPDYAGATFDLSAKRAVIVGNGNVALDVARILTADIRTLERTDIADHALAALRESNVEEVIILGRRGPAEAAFSFSELVGLRQRPGLDVNVDFQEGQTSPPASIVASPRPHPITSLKTELLNELTAEPNRPGNNRIVLRFLTSPVALIGADAVRGLRVCRNEMLRLPSGDLSSVPTADTEDIDCGLVFRAVGYRGTPVPGIPFDESRGTLPNEAGRVLDAPHGAPIPGVYTAGWIKRGPSGVIGTNKNCAEATVRALLEDFTRGRLAANVEDGLSLRSLVTQRQPSVVDHAGWKAIDTHERSAGREQGRERVKVVDVEKMLDIIDAFPPGRRFL